MAAKNKCRVRWSDAAGTNWHSCCLAANHKGPHKSPMGHKPIPQASVVYDYDAWGKVVYRYPEGDKGAYPE